MNLFVLSAFLLLSLQLSAPNLFLNNLFESPAPQVDWRANEHHRSYSNDSESSKAKIIRSQLSHVSVSLTSWALFYPNMQVVAGTSTTGLSGEVQATSAMISARQLWVDPAGNIYLPDSDHFIIRRVGVNGIIANFLGNGTQSTVGVSGGKVTVSVNMPWSIVGDTAGVALYFSDVRYVWKYTFANDMAVVLAQDPIATVPGFSGDNATAISAQLNSPSGLWLTTSGELYIADLLNNRIRKIALNNIITTIAGSGAVGNGTGSFSGDGFPATSATLNTPYGVYMDTTGKVFIADYGNQRIRVVETNYIISTYAGIGPIGGSKDDNVAAATASIHANDVKGDTLGNIYFTDPVKCIVRVVEKASGMVFTVFGTFGNCGFSAGTSPRTSVIGPGSGIWLDSQSTIFFSDSNSIRRSVFAPTSQPTGEPSGQPTNQPTCQPSLQPSSAPSTERFSTLATMQVVAGTGTAGYNGEGGLASTSPIRGQQIWVDSVDQIYIADETNYRIRRVELNGIITSFAGKGITSTSGTSGPANSKSIGVPYSIMGDLTGTTLYFSDQRYIWLYSSNSISVYAHSKALNLGFSGDGGQAVDAQLNNPLGIWVTTSGVLYIADQYNHRIRKIVSNIITTVVGSGPTGVGVGSFSGDGGPATSATLNTPYGVYMDTNGKLFIADYGNKRVRMVLANQIITTFIGTGSDGGYNGDNLPVLSTNVFPMDVKGDSRGNIYIADYDTCLIRVATVNGIVKNIFGSPQTCGFSPGVSPREAVIQNPRGIWIDSQSNIYFSDGVTVRRNAGLTIPTGQPSSDPTHQPTRQPSSQPTKQPYIRPTGQPTSLPSCQPTRQPISRPSGQPTCQPIANPSGQPSSQPSLQPILLPSGQPSCQPFSNPSGQPSSQPSSQPSRQPVMRPSSQPTRIPSSQPTLSPTEQPHSYMQLLAGGTLTGNTGDDGPATLATMYGRMPWVDSMGIVYIPESINARIRRISQNGIISAFGGNGTSASSGIPGSISSVQFYRPFSIIGDNAGTVLYISDEVFVWKYYFATDNVSVFCGNSTQGFSGDSGPASAAQLNSPYGLWLTTSDYLYIADRDNNRIRKVSNGIISTIAGSSTVGGSSGDEGPATLAQLNLPSSVYVDSTGIIFIADSGNSKIRVIDLQNIISLFAGRNPGFLDNTLRLSARFLSPRDLKGDKWGNLYVADYYNYRVRMIEPNGFVTTVFGNGSLGFSPGLSPARSAVGAVTGIWIDSMSTIYFCDVHSIYRSVSLQPTGQPTAQPSIPTSQPSSLPSLQPSAGPSSSPTRRPNTSRPTGHPSLGPTSVPAGSPSSRPSGRSSPMPSGDIPSSESTRLPSSLPPRFPSVNPTGQPSSFPTRIPISFQPAVEQLPTTFRPSSLLPSGRPSFQPNSKPSTFPSGIPTCQPFSLPTRFPSVKPSCQPSNRPSDYSISFPFGRPTSFPTTQPSGYPSGCPTSVGSIHPSVQPSICPSSFLSFAPTSQPTRRPSEQPVSFCPSSRPSIRPVEQHSSTPPTFFSDRPLQSSQPVSPTVDPSFQPSRDPSIRPSNSPSTNLEEEPPPISPTPSHRDDSLGPTQVRTVSPTCDPVSSAVPSLSPSQHESSLQPSFPPSYRPFESPTTFRPTAPTNSQPTTTIPTSQPFSLPMTSIYSTNDVIFFPGNSLYSEEGTMNTRKDEPLGLSYILFGRNLKNKDEGFPLVIALASGSTSSRRFASLITDSASGIRGESVTQSATVLGDINKDGHLDLMIGRPLESKCFVCLGRSGGFDGSESFSIVGDLDQDGGGQLGWASTRVGDLNHDGFDEIVVSAPYANVVHFIYGRLAFQDIAVVGLKPEDGFKVIGSQQDTYFGVALSAVHDFNKDGKQDFAVTAIRPGGANVIYVILSIASFGQHDINIDQLSPAFCFTIVAPYLSYAGFSIAGIGDLNSDGYNDLAIGSIPIRNARYVEQKTYIVYGRELSGPNSLYLSDMTAKDGIIVAGAGFLVQAAGDVNADGIPDVMLTSYYDWKGKGNTYLIKYPMNVTYSPTIQPSSSPSSQPFSIPSAVPSSSFPSSTPSVAQTTFYPTSRNSFVTLSPQRALTRIPTVKATGKPSRTPSFRPSRSSNPSLLPSYLPSWEPTLLPTAIHIAPSAPPVNDKVVTDQPSYPQFLRSRMPTMVPTVETTLNTTAFTEVDCHNPGSYSGQNKTNYRFKITADSGTVIITGVEYGGVKNLYILSSCPSDRVDVVITNFRLSWDIISITHLESSGYSYRSLDQISYFTRAGDNQPLTLLFCEENKLQVILSSQTSFRLESGNFLFIPSKSTGGPVGKQNSVLVQAELGIVFAVFVVIYLIFYAEVYQIRLDEQEHEQQFLLSEEEETMQPIEYVEERDTIPGNVLVAELPTSTSHRHPANNNNTSPVVQVSSSYSSSYSSSSSYEGSNEGDKRQSGIQREQTDGQLDTSNHDLTVSCDHEKEEQSKPGQLLSSEILLDHLKENEEVQGVVLAAEICTPHESHENIECETHGKHETLQSAEHSLSHSSDSSSSDEGEHVPSVEQRNSINSDDWLDALSLSDNEEPVVELAVSCFIPTIPDGNIEIIPGIVDSSNNLVHFSEESQLHSLNSLESLDSLDSDNSVFRE
jgi:sugar lactone lactonase YvrE